MEGSSCYQGYIRELDGVRAIAVILVLLNHFAPIKTLPQYINVRQIGWVGVHVFFVLSGFLITGVLLDATTENYLRNFFLRRVLRIFPLYYALLAIVIGIMFFVKDGEQYRQMVATWGHPAWFFAYLGNIKTAITGEMPPRYFQAMWSLHVEEQFYIVFPFLVLRLDRRSLSRTLIALIVAAPVVRFALWWMFPAKPLLQYMLLPCRMDGLAVGALVALRLRMGPWVISRMHLAAVTFCTTLLAVAVFVAGGRGFDTPLERTIGYSIFAFTFGSGLLWIVMFRGGPATNWLNVAPLNFMGRISYGLYLFQLPIAVYLSHFAKHFGVASGWLESLQGSTLAILCSVLVSAASWYGFERPILRLKEYVAPARPATRTAPFIGTPVPQND